MPTFYIDFNSGSDDNYGITTASAWRTIPGTTKPNAAVNYRTAYSKSLNQTYRPSVGNRIPTGSLFIMKRGTTYTGTSGSTDVVSGLVWLDKEWYDDATTIGSASIQNAFTFQPDNIGWGNPILPVTFDLQWSQSMTVSNIHDIVLSQLDGVTFDGISASGIVFQNSTGSGYYIKAKAGTNLATLNPIVKYCKFYNNGNAYATDAAGAGSAQLQFQRATNVLVTNVELDGNQRYINGIICGDSNVEVLNATVSNCISHNHLGDVSNNDSGIGYKAFNSQVLYTNNQSYNNLKGWDMGQSGTSRQYSMSYKVINCDSYNNKWGINMNSDGNVRFSASYFGYSINNRIYNNTIFGMNCYAGPLNIHIVNNVFDNNGGGGNTVPPVNYYGHCRLTSNDKSDGSRVIGHVYNNIFNQTSSSISASVAIPTSVFENSSFDLLINNYTFDSDFNAYVRGHANEHFFRWSFQAAYTGSGNSASGSISGSAPTDFAYGINGPGYNSGNWYNWYGSSASMNPFPGNGQLGHYHCDANSVGTSCSIQTMPPFTNSGSHDYTLTTNYLGLNLSTASWYIPEMGIDRNGVARTNWDKGLYEFTSSFTPITNLTNKTIFFRWNGMVGNVWKI